MHTNTSMSIAMYMSKIRIKLQRPHFHECQWQKVLTLAKGSLYDISFVTQQIGNIYLAALQNTPSLSWLENVSILRYFGSSWLSSFSRISSCGRQFLTCGGPSSSLSRANLAADIARPLNPSPHSFSALSCTNVQLVSRVQHLSLIHIWRCRRRG